MAGNQLTVDGVLSILSGNRPEDEQETVTTPSTIKPKPKQPAMNVESVLQKLNAYSQPTVEPQDDAIPVAPVTIPQEEVTSVIEAQPAPVEPVMQEPVSQRKITVANEQEFNDRLNTLENEYGDVFYQIPEDWGLDDRIRKQFETDLRSTISNEVERAKQESGIQNFEMAGYMQEIGMDPYVNVPIRDPEEIQRNIEEQADAVQALLDDPNQSRSRITQELLDRGMPLKDIVTTVTLLDIAPVSGTFLGAQDIPIMYGEAKKQYEEGDIAGAATTAGLMGVEAVASTVGTLVGAKAIVDATRAGGRAARSSRALSRAYRNNAEIARTAEKDAASAARQRAAEVAAANADIQQDMIRSFEARTGKPIADELPDGTLRINPDLVRQAGIDTMMETSGDAGRLALGEQVITQPVLIPHKFDALVAIASDYKQQFPDAFPEGRSVIDSLFDLTVNQKLKAGPELLDDLNKYGLSFEDYMLAVVGSGSEAGRTLQKLSQIRRAKPEGVAIADEAARKAKEEGALRKGVMRIENVRRGGLVSQIATAARNLQSAVIRAPMEGLGNVMDTALLNLSEKGIGAAAKSMVSPQNWKDSFAHLGYMFSRPDVAKSYTDYILQRPELLNQYDRMFNNLNEIQEATGRGSGTMFDKIITPLEDTVDVLNIPNRWQEYLIRRGTFFAELQRLTRNEYGIDLIDTLQQGKVKDLLNDASNVKPAKARSFNALVDEAVTRALDVTYSKMPEIPVFRSTSQFIVRNGLTVAIPFPRFMFNAMELMGQYAGGASIPLTRKLMGTVSAGHRGKLTAKDRQRISRNLVGMATIGAAYMYRTREDAPPDYKMMDTTEGVMMDVSPQFPMRQYMYLGEATKQYINGTFDDWFNAREFVETFTGTNFRVGVGNAFLDEVAALADGTDLSKGEAVGRITGSTLGNYLSSWLVPFGQIIEAERAAGIRGLEFKDVREDPTLDGFTTFFNELKRPAQARGYITTPAMEKEFPERVNVFNPDAKRVGPAWRATLGISLVERDEEYGEYLTAKGFNQYDVSSTSEVPTVQRWQNEQLSKIMPIISEVAMEREKVLREEYATRSEAYREAFTEEEHVNNNVIPLIKSLVTDARSKVNSIPVGAKDPYTNAIVAYRRLPAEFRKLATGEFVERYEREPDPTSAEDLQTLTVIGIAYTKAYK